MPSTLSQFYARPGGQSSERRIANSRRADLISPSRIRYINGPALLDFTKVIELRPSDPNGWIERGRLYLDLNNFHAAVADASQAIAVSPNQAAAFSLRGTALRKGGDPKKAIEDFNRALALEPSANNYFERGSTYQLLGEHQLAIADFDHVIEMIPDLASPFFARAQSRRALGDLSGAERDHQQGRILDGN